MGTTRIKVIDLSSDQQEIKTSRKHAEKLTGAAKIKEEKKPRETKAKEPEEIKEQVQKPEEAEITQTEIATTKPAVSETTPKPPAEKKTAAAAKKPPRHRGKKYQQAAALIDKTKVYPAREALDLLPKISPTSFDPTVEVHLSVNDKNIRGKVNFPHMVGTKKEKRYLVFSPKKTEAKNVTWADEKTIPEIESGKLKPGRDFDTVITTPAYMPQLAKVAKILGPRGMMPNPKNGTITNDPAKILTLSDDTSYEFKTDPTAPIVHTKIGKLSANSAALEENLKALVAAVGPTKIKKALIKSTMSPAIRVDTATLGH